MRTILKISSLLCLAICLGYSCKKKEQAATGTNPVDSFDRVALLNNIASTVILPAYQDFNARCVSLNSAISSFNLSPDSARLSSLQNTFKAAYRSWQSASPFAFGPADEEYLNENTNIFPIDTAKIKANINSGTFDLNAIVNLDAKGLPAIDYLLFGTGPDNASILLKYTTEAQATNRKKYLAALSAAMKANMNTVLNEWSSYTTTFLNAKGTDVGSSLGQLINEMDEDLEVLKNDALGIPLGKQSMGELLPSKVEAYYSRMSSELALLHLKSIQNVYMGKDGQGIDDYLTAINAKYNGGSLNDAIKSQFSAAVGKLQAVPDPLSANITSNTAVVNAAYVEIQKLVVLLKTDMPSALGILITYEDTDGD